MGGSQESVKSKLEHEKEYLKKMEKYNEEKSLQQEINKIKKSKLSDSFSYKINFKISKSKNSAKPKKYNLNILYYDEHLKNDEENSDNCSFIEMNTNGTFYGCHNFELFKIVVIN